MWVGKGKLVSGVFTGFWVLSFGGAGVEDGGSSSVKLPSALAEEKKNEESTVIYL